MTFQEAMKKVFEGYRIHQSGWVPNVYIECNEGADSNMIVPVIVTANEDGTIEDLRIYELTRMDFFATDWEIV